MTLKRFMNYLRGKTGSSTKVDPMFISPVIDSPSTTMRLQSSLIASLQPMDIQPTITQPAVCNLPLMSKPKTPSVEKFDFSGDRSFPQRTVTTIHWVNGEEHAYKFTHTCILQATLKRGVPVFFSHSTMTEEKMPQTDQYRPSVMNGVKAKQNTWMGKGKGKGKGKANRGGNRNRRKGGKGQGNSRKFQGPSVPQ
jgi:hypothetical protein